MTEPVPSTIQFSARKVTEEVHFKLDPDTTPRFELFEGLAVPVSGEATRKVYPNLDGELTDFQEIVLVSYHNGVRVTNYFSGEDISMIPDGLLGDILGLFGDLPSFESKD